jgi:hypothetical protein
MTTRSFYIGQLISNQITHILYLSISLIDQIKMDKQLYIICSTEETKLII